jgi:hypothetical protein
VIIAEIADYFVLEFDDLRVCDAFVDLCSVGFLHV